MIGVIRILLILPPPLIPPLCIRGGLREVRIFIVINPGVDFKFFLIWQGNFMKKTYLSAMK